MNNLTTYKALTKSFIKSIQMSKSTTKRTRIVMRVWVTLIMLFVLVPVAIFATLGTYAMTLNLKLLGDAQDLLLVDLGVAVMFHLVCLFTLFFGFNVIFNEFYFSSDIEFVKPWPVRAWELVASKFTVSYFVDNLMQILLVIASLIGFIGASFQNPIALSTFEKIISWLSIATSIFTLPIVPLCYCGIISIVVMRFTRSIKNKGTVQKLSGFVVAALLIVFAILFRVFSSKGGDAIAFFFTETGSPFAEYMNKLFPTVYFISRAISYGSIKDLLIYAVVNIAFVAVMLALSELWYFKGFDNLSVNKKVRDANLSDMLAKSVQEPVWKAYLKKEWRILVRTPAFFTNSVIVNFLWPAFVFVILKFQTYEITITSLKMYCINRPVNSGFFFLTGAIILSLVMAGINSLASNSISREGKHFQFLKYIPVSYDLQWDVKVIISVVLTFAGIWVYVLPLAIIVGVKFYYIILALMLSFLSITFMSYFGVYMDSIQPKLVWDDELSVLRENTNVALAMGVALGIALIFGGIAYVFYAFFKIRLVLLTAVYFFVLGILNLLAIKKSSKKGKINIAMQEEM